MSTETVDCPEAVGKTVKSLQLYSTAAASLSEIVLEFTDGTTFSASFECQMTPKASLIRTGIGEPEVLKTFV